MHLAKSQICSQTQSRTHMHGVSVPLTTQLQLFVLELFHLCIDKFVKRKLMLITLGTVFLRTLILPILCDR